MRRPYVIGVTGGFGTGKSTVARMFGAFGASVLNADTIAHEIILPGNAVYKKVLSIFGAEVLNKNKKIDREKLGKIIFHDKKKRLLLNSIIHPEVIKEIKERMGDKPGKIYVIDVPLLIEAGLHSMTDALVVVTADKNTQMRRCMRKWGLTRRDIERRIRGQMSLQKKRRLADFIIDNNGSLNSTRKKVKKVWREIKDGTIGR